MRKVEIKITRPAVTTFANAPAAKIDSCTMSFCFFNLSSGGSTKASGRKASRPTPDDFNFNFHASDTTPCMPSCTTITKNKAMMPYQNGIIRSEEHTSELQSQFHLVCRL